MDEFKIGLIGFGTVGAGVVDNLQKNKELLTGRCGLKPVLARIADLDITTDRGVSVDPAILTTHADDILNDPEIDVVIELVGGTTVAREFTLRALANGKPVVTANKALLSRHGEEIFAAAEESGVDIYYEASVGGGIPIIKVLREGLVANNINAIYAILNGTCNYILTRMANEGLDFNDILREAQKLGYAEAEPSMDIDGHDTAHKAALLASLAYGDWVTPQHFHVEGIRNLDLVDIRIAAELGYKVKLLAIIKMDDGKIQVRVHPTMLLAHSMLATVDDVFNAVWVKGDYVGDSMLYGRGAGRAATASSVVADVMDVGLNLKFGAKNRIPGFRPHRSDRTIVPMSAVHSRYYLRMVVADCPGVLASVSQLLANARISIASVLQRESTQDTVPLIIITHRALESDLQQALTGIRALDAIKQEPVLLRIEDV